MRSNVSSLSSASYSDISAENEEPSPAISSLSVLSALGNTVFLVFRYPTLLLLIFLSSLTADISFIVFSLGGLMFTTYTWALYALLVSQPHSLRLLITNGWRIYWSSLATIISWFFCVMLLFFGTIPILRWALRQELFDFTINLPIPYESFIWLLLLFVIAAEVTSQDRSFLARLRAPFYLAKRFWLCSLLFLLLTYLLPIAYAYPTLIQYLDSVPTSNDWLQGAAEVHWLLRLQTVDGLSNQKQLADWLWVFALFTTAGCIVQLALQIRPSSSQPCISPHFTRLHRRPWSLAGLYVVAALVVGILALGEPDTWDRPILSKQLVEFGHPSVMSLHYESDETLLLSDMKTVCRIKTSGWFTKCQWLWNVEDEDSFLKAVEFSASHERFMTVTDDRSAGKWGGENILRVHSSIDGQIQYELPIPWLRVYTVGFQNKSIAFDAVGEYAATLTPAAGGDTSVVVGALNQWDDARLIELGTRIDDVELSPNGQRLAIITEEGAMLSEWQTDDALNSLDLSEIRANDIVDNSQHSDADNDISQSQYLNTDKAKPTFPTEILDVVFSHNGNSIIVLTAKEMLLLDVNTLEIRYSITFDKVYEDTELARLRLASAPGYVIVIGKGKPVQAAKTQGIGGDYSNRNRVFAHIVRLKDGVMLDSIPAGIIDVDFLPSKHYVAVSGRDSSSTKGILQTILDDESSVLLYRVSQIQSQ